MPTKTPTKPKADERYDVYLVMQLKPYFSQRFKTRHGAERHRDRLNQKYRRYGYHSTIETRTPDAKGVYPDPGVKHQFHNL